MNDGVVLRLFVFVLTLVIASCSDPRLQVNERVAYWTKFIDASIPPGTEHSVVVTWAEAQKLRFSDIRDEHKYGGRVETLPDHFPCKEYWISAYVLFDERDLSVRNKVSTFNVCL